MEPVKELQQVIKTFNDGLAEWQKKYKDLDFNLGWDYTSEEYKGVKLLSVSNDLFRVQPNVEEAMKKFQDLTR